MSGPDVSKTQMMKSYIWLQTSDGSIEQVEQDVALCCPFIHNKTYAGMGFSKIEPIVLPSPVKFTILGVILDYCRFYNLSGRSKLERKCFNEKFFRMETESLYELTSAAHSLQMSPLVELGCDALARQIGGKSNEEIRQALGLPDDVTEEESWKPIELGTDDPHVRLLNKLYARKRKGLKEKEKLVLPEAPHADDRSVDELLSFINGENGDPKEAKPSKNKKKHRKGKNKQKIASSVCTISDSSGHSNNDNARICMP